MGATILQLISSTRYALNRTYIPKFLSGAV